jgi:hypothetical protein
VWKRTKPWCMLILVMSLLFSCGRQTVDQVPEDVHAAWVQAMRTSDRAAALVLAADQPFKEAFVDDHLRTIRDKMTAASSRTGPLETVEVHAMTDNGQQKVGVSVWRFQHRTDCYSTVLTPTPGGWKVIGWGTLLRCV